jgi:hypothetical protein
MVNQSRKNIAGWYGAPAHGANPSFRAPHQDAAPRVRVIVDPLGQLEMTETSSVSFTGVRSSQSLVYDLVATTSANYFNSI